MNIKHIKKVLLFTVLSFIVFLPITKIYAAENTDTTNQIKGVITNYFNGEYESIKKGQAVNADNIIGNAKLKEFTNLRNTREGLWYKKLNYKLVNYSININYNSINFTGDICTIDLSKDTQFSFDIDPNTVSKESDNKHVIILKKTDNKWLIDCDVDIHNDIDSEANQSNSSANASIKKSAVINATTDLNKKILNLKEKAKNINTEVNEYKQFKQNVINSRKKAASYVKQNAVNSRTKAASNGSFEGRKWQINYNRMAAVAYAHKWYDSRNNSYRSYPSDCVNFVSQSIFAGAPVMNNEILGWFNGKLMASPAWINLGEQWKFLTTNTGKGPVAIDNTNRYDIDYGDVIDLWNTAHNMYYHAVIVTKLSTTGEVYYSAHTDKQIDKPLSYAYSKGENTKSKQRTAHILGYNK